MPRKPDPYIPTPDEKTAGLGAAFYEMQQFCNCVRVLWTALDQAAENSFLESMLIHVRVLQDFFQKDRRRLFKGTELDDVLSKDFGYPSASIPLRADYESRIDKEVAHLTYTRAQRLTRQQKEWDPVAFLPLVIRCILFIEFIETHDEEILRRLEQFRVKHDMPELSSTQVKGALSQIRVTFETAAHPGPTATGASG
jgi:hypothetical protein